MSRKLASKKKAKKENPNIEITRSILQYVVTLFVVTLCIFIPFYMQNGYYKIGDAKFAAYKNIMLWGMPIVFVLLILYRAFDWKENGFVKRVKELPKHMLPTDWFFLGFYLIVVISYFASGNMEQAFWGYSGWYMGLFFQTTILALYLILSGYGQYYKVAFATLCGVAFITYIIGILHRLLIDPIGTYEGISDYYKTQFLSTLGQASWYSSFVCTVLPLGVCCYYIAKTNAIRVISGIFTLVGFMTLVTQNSDSAYIAFTLLVMLLFYFAAGSAPSMLRFLELLVMFFAAPKLMRLLLLLHPNPTLDLDKISYMLVFGRISFVFLPLLAVMWGVIFRLNNRKLYPAKQVCILRNALYCIFVVAIIFAVVILRLSATGKLSGGLLSISQAIPYLSWDNTWGNGRGFTWTATAKIIGEMPFGRKLIGVGPDCYSYYAYEHYADYINSMWGENILTNAHNEWINMIVNYGFLGAASYIGIFISALAGFVKHAKEEPVLIACAGCIVAYMGHNVFCYQQVLCTPFVIIIMGYGVYLLRTIKK